MDSTHAEVISKLQAQIREYFSRQVPFRIYHGSTNSTRVLTFKRSEMVDTSNLDRVLHIDKAKRTAIVEPNVSMDKLLESTLEYGLMPPVVTEFPGITVGGAIQGGAIESGSFKWGAFGQTVNWIEMVLGNGDKLKVSPKKHSDLFYGTIGSYGSLGLVTAAEVKLIPAKKYVAIAVLPVKSFAEGLTMTEKYAKLPYDFVEFAMSKKDCGAVAVGKLTEEVQGKLLRVSRARDPWYYMYTRNYALRSETVTFTMPLRDYIFRYDRGAFCAAELAFKQKGIPFNALTRFIFDPLLHTRKLYKAVQDSAAGQRYICQDIVLPKKGVVPFMNFIDKELTMYPTGFVAVAPEIRSKLQFNSINDTEYTFNVGIYGLRIEPYEKFIAVNRQIEAKTQELGGRKWFYAHSYYSEKDFWKIYDKKWYEALRKKYHATTLPSIYDRISVKETYEVHTKRAILKTLFGRAKLRIVD